MARGLKGVRLAGYRPELAWTCCDYADALLQRNGDGARAVPARDTEGVAPLSSIYRPCGRANRVGGAVTDPASHMRSTHQAVQ